MLGARLGRPAGCARPLNGWPRIWEKRAATSARVNAGLLFMAGKRGLLQGWLSPKRRAHFAGAAGDASMFSVRSNRGMLSSLIQLRFFNVPTDELDHLLPPRAFLFA